MHSILKEFVKKSQLEDPDFPIDTWDHPELEQFAELIIRECANSVRGVPTCGPGSKGCDEIIREHFGIKK